MHVTHGQANLAHLRSLSSSILSLHGQQLDAHLIMVSELQQLSQHFIVKFCHQAAMYIPACMGPGRTVRALAQPVNRSIQLLQELDAEASIHVVQEPTG